MGCSTWNQLKQPAGRRHMSKLRRWGPWAWSACQVGQPPPSFVQQAVLGLLVLTQSGLASLEWSELGFWATLGPFEPESVL